MENKMQTIHAIHESKAPGSIKIILTTIAGDFEDFLRLKEKCGDSGLMKATREMWGFSFLGVYGINTLKDLEVLANKF